jgi:predicted small secreted protein
MRKVMIAAMAGLALASAGCNTVEGLGRDLSATGDAITDAAHDTRTAKPVKKHHAAGAPCAANPSHATSPAVC